MMGCGSSKKKANENVAVSPPQPVNVPKETPQAQPPPAKPSSEVNVTPANVSSKMVEAAQVEPKIEEPKNQTSKEATKTTSAAQQLTSKSTTKANVPAEPDKDVQAGSKLKIAVGSKVDGQKSKLEEKKEGTANSEPKTGNTGGKTEEQIKGERRRRKRRNLLTDQKANPEVWAAARSSQELIKDMRVLLSDAPEKRASAEVMKQVKQSVSLEDQIRSKLTKSQENVGQSKVGTPVKSRASKLSP